MSTADRPADLDTPPTRPPPIPGTGVAERRIDDAFCIRCGYALRGLAPSGLCPECGTPVDRSLRGDLIEFSDAEYVRTIHRGVFLVQAAIIALLVLIVTIVILGFSLPGARSIEIGGMIATAAANAALLAGWWLFSAPDPSVLGRETGAAARKVVRVATLISAAVTVAQFVFELAVPQPGLAAAGPGSGAPPANSAALLAALALQIAGLAAFALGYFAAMRYLQWLAPRLPDERVLGRARRMMWLGPLLYTVGILLLGLGPLIALVLYYNLLDWVRRDLRAIRARMQTEPA